MSKVFGRNLYVYGGIVDEGVSEASHSHVDISSARILATRQGAVCVVTCDRKGIWITHARRPKSRTDKALWPKVQATLCLIELGILTAAQVELLQWALPTNWSLSPVRTFQEVWVEFNVDENGNKTAYLYFDFYNGAMATSQCSHLIDAMAYIVSKSTSDHPVHAVVLMGGVYFSNGIALNVIEAAADPAMESWLNINRIDDVVHMLLYKFPSRGILTVAAIRSNAAAGGVALATACDVVIAGSDVVLNPAYRAVGLYGSEYHTLSYYGRCGETNAKAILRAMTPISPLQAQSIGLVDYIFPGSGKILEERIRYHIALLLKPKILTQGSWKASVDLSPASLAHTRALELSEMCKDFWSARSVRYHSRRFDFVRKVKPLQTPLRFATHRRQPHSTAYDEEELDSFDDVECYKQLAEKQAAAGLRDQVREELSALVGRWAEKESKARSHRQGSVTLLTEKETAHVALPGVERRTETLFSCYYRPVKGPLTPPVSPFNEATSGVVN